MSNNDSDTACSFLSLFIRKKRASRASKTGMMHFPLPAALSFCSTQKKYTHFRYSCIEDPLAGPAIRRTLKSNKDFGFKAFYDKHMRFTCIASRKQRSRMGLRYMVYGKSCLRMFKYTYRDSIFQHVLSRIRDQINGSNSKLHQQDLLTLCEISTMDAKFSFHHLRVTNPLPSQ